MKSFRIPALVSLLTLAGCATESQIKTALDRNPDLILDVIAKNPERFMAVATKAHADADRLAKEKQLNEAFAHPRKPVLDPLRAYRGAADAPITIVEYSDFQCPYCKMAAGIVKDVRAKYDGKTRVLYKHLPLPFHPQSRIAAQMFEAIALQSPEKAYAYYDAIFEAQDRLAQEKQALLDDICKKVGADVARAKKDMTSDEVQKRISADTSEAESFGFTGTPCFLINGIPVEGAQPIDQFSTVIDRLL